jgi:hypothetical protein
LWQSPGRGQFAGQVFLCLSFFAVFTFPANAAVESKDMARSEKTIFFIFLILEIKTIIFLSGHIRPGEDASNLND